MYPFIILASLVSNVIKDAVSDGLIVKTVDGLLQLPPTNWKSGHSDDQDWYCYECHAAGDVQKCESCPRVFHISCIVTDAEKQELWDKLDYHRDKQQNTLLTYKEPDPKQTNDDDVDQTKNVTIGEESKLRRYCYGCRLVHKGQALKKNDMTKEELHYLLTFAYNRVHSWVRTKETT